MERDLSINLLGSIFIGGEMTSLEENETLRVGDGDDEVEADLGDVDGDGDTDLGDVKFLFIRFIMKKLKKIKIK